MIKLNFPVIAYNLTDREWEEPVLDQYVVKKVGNLKVALIGLTYPWTALTSAITGAAKWFKFGIKEEEARDLIADIRKNENPDLIVFVSHGGYGLDQKFAQRVDGIDIYLSGHTHDEVFDPVVWNDTPSSSRAVPMGNMLSVLMLMLKIRKYKILIIVYSK